MMHRPIQAKIKQQICSIVKQKKGIGNISRIHSISFVVVVVALSDSFHIHIYVL